MLSAGAFGPRAPSAVSSYNTTPSVARGNAAAYLVQKLVLRFVDRSSRFETKPSAAAANRKIAAKIQRDHAERGYDVAIGHRRLALRVLGEPAEAAHSDQQQPFHHGENPSDSGGGDSGA